MDEKAVTKKDRSNVRRTEVTFHPYFLHSLSLHQQENNFVRRKGVLYKTFTLPATVEVSAPRDLAISRKDLEMAEDKRMIKKKKEKHSVD